MREHPTPGRQSAPWTASFVAESRCNARKIAGTIIQPVNLIVRLQNMPPRPMISKVAYDFLKHKLTVSFRSGQSFEFHSVPGRVAFLLQQATDQLGFFERSVRGHYPWLELSDGRVVRRAFAAGDLRKFPPEIATKARTSAMTHLA
ncbi:MAG: KTSC domain-containing protein [bacterium]